MKRTVEVSRSVSP